jgi:hypothetical protein
MECNALMPMNALPLYQLLTAHLPETPNLTIVQTPSPCPEPWPLILKEVRMARRQAIGFVVFDGKTQVLCKASVPEVYDKILSLDAGAIIHLRGALPVFMESEKAYGLEIETVLTLKEFDDELKRRNAKEERRKARMQDQLRKEGYLKDPDEEEEEMQALPALEPIAASS